MTLLSGPANSRQAIFRASGDLEVDGQLLSEGLVISAPPLRPLTVQTDILNVLPSTTGGTGEITISNEA